MTWAYEVLEEALADIVNECRLATCKYGALTAVAFFLAISDPCSLARDK